MKNLLGQYGLVLIGTMVALAVCLSYFVGYNKAIRDAEPYVEEGVQYIVYDTEVHCYGLVREAE